jgi:hypothetical protein
VKCAHKTFSVHFHHISSSRLSVLDSFRFISIALHPLASAF